MDALSFDGQPLQDQNQIRFFDAEFLLMYLKTDEGIKEEVFHETMAVPMYNAQSNYKKVRAFGEIFDILWKQGQYDSVVQLADFCKKLTATEEFSHLCTYSLGHLDSDSYDEAIECICKHHAYLAPQEHDDSTEQQMDKTMDAFGTAWNRVIHKWHIKQ